MDDVLSRALDSLREVVPYASAAAYELSDDVLHRVALDGPQSPAVPQTLALDAAPGLRKALDERRVVVLHPAGGNDFGGEEASLLCVPLFAGQHSLGVITLERRGHAPFSEQDGSFARAHAKVVALTMVVARQARLLERQGRLLEEGNRLLRIELGADQLACGRVEVSRSPLMKDVVVRAKQLALTNVPVLVMGERGSGKELLAQAIHAWSPRAHAPLVKVSCSALPARLFESELFGSPSSSQGMGRLLIANGGTLLLDEISEMPLDAQLQMVRVLRDGTFSTPGVPGSHRVDLRVIASTNVDLSALVEQGRFREDLYHRLAVFPLNVPPLRERPEDLAPLAERHLADISLRSGRGPWELSDSAIAALERYSWPGNVRELINGLERGAIVRPSGILSVADLGLAGFVEQEPPPASVSREAFPSFVENERVYFERALTLTGGKLHGGDGAASLVGLKPTTLQSRLKKLGIEPRRWKRRQLGSMRSAPEMLAGRG